MKMRPFIVEIFRKKLSFKVGVSMLYLVLFLPVKTLEVKVF